MAMTTNLTDPYDIVAAIKKKVGIGGVSVCASETGFAVPYVSLHIHKRRGSRRVLQAMANWLGCGVHGVFPEGPAKPGSGEGSH